MLEAVVVFCDKFFCADDARIGKVSCTVPETIDLVYFEISFYLFLNFFSAIWEPFSAVLEPFS